MTCQECLPLIGAFADGELDAANDAAVRTHIGTCPTCQVEYEAILALRAKFADLQPHLAPESLRRQLESKLPGQASPRQSRPRIVWWSLAGLAVAALLLVVFLGRPRTEDRLTDQIVDSHVRSLIASHLLDVVSTDRHTVKPWFNGRVATSATPWDMQAEGYPLLGGRLDYIDARPTEVLVYGRRKHFINLFVLPGQVASGTWSKDSQGFHLLAWPENGMEFVAVSDVDLADLAQFKSAYLKQE